MVMMRMTLSHTHTHTHPVYVLVSVALTVNPLNELTHTVVMMVMTPAPHYTS